MTVYFKKTFRKFFFVEGKIKYVSKISTFDFFAEFFQFFAEIWWDNKKEQKRLTLVTCLMSQSPLDCKRWLISLQPWMKIRRCIANGSDWKWSRFWKWKEINSKMFPWNVLRKIYNAFYSIYVSIKWINKSHLHALIYRKKNFGNFPRESK